MIQKMWLSPEEVAERIGRSVQFVRGLCRAGQLRAKKTSTTKQAHLMIEACSVDAWLESLPDAASV